MNSLIVNKREYIDNKPLKIVFVGNVGAGKSTAVAAISETPVIGDEEQDALNPLQTTTVSLEYGIAYINNTKAHIYGTPGQRRFHFMSSVASRGANGMIILIDNSCKQPLSELDYFLQTYHEFLKEHPAIIGITHYDDKNTKTYLIDYHRYVRDNGFSCPVICLDTREKNQVQKTVKKLYNEITRYVS